MQGIFIAPVAFTINISFEAGGCNYNSFAALFNEMPGSLVTAFVIINNDRSVILIILFNPVKKYERDSFVIKRFKMIKVFCFECKRSDQAIYTLIKKVFCICNFFFKTL